MQRAAQWYILCHPNTYVPKVMGTQNFGSLFLGALYIYSCQWPTEASASTHSYTQNLVVALVSHNCEKSILFHLCSLSTSCLW